MSVTSLIASFENHPYTKVDVNQVRDRIIELRPSLSYFEFTEFDPQEHPYLDGMYEEEHIKKGWGLPDEYTTVGYVYTNKSLDDKHYRVTVCKEMIHSLDPNKSKTVDLDAIITLSEEVALPQLLSAFSCHTTRDKACLLLAIYVLFPLSTREAFLDGYQKQQITSQEISDLVAIPEEFVLLVMSPAWQFVCEKVIAPYLAQEEQDDEQGDAEEKKFFAEIASVENN